MTAPSPPPGWYPDPSGRPGRRRYWNGQSWAEPPKPKRRLPWWGWLWVTVAIVVLAIVATVTGHHDNNDGNNPCREHASACAPISASAAAPQGPKLPAGVKDLTFDVKPSPDGDIVTAHFKIQDNFTKGMMKDGARIDTVNILKYALAEYPNLSEVDVDANADMVDPYGRTKVDQVATLIYTRESLGKINWEDFDFHNAWNTPIALPMYIHPDFLY